MTTDKLEQIITKFNYWNNRGKSAICRYLLEVLNITPKEFNGFLDDWKERKLVRTSDNKDFEVIIE